ncbi:PfWMP4_29 [Phormidium phage Pf-WMP4]|uniref:PfWMP4_29 n=1 Tax=Phormidium phage Pf-WMP4 TaxID=2913979 RepID=Q0GBT7_9CAUD|nr:PfWMP4_29 [Phormidium phage Pf-WMP4]ABI33173.1 PfWMP4_29 [Phormidium phage Pf-WMP4]
MPGELDEFEAEFEAVTQEIEELEAEAEETDQAWEEYQESK